MIERQRGATAWPLALARRRWFVPAVLAAAIALRLLWQAFRGPDWVSGGEIVNSAVAFASTGRLIDAYRPGHGYTAHVSAIPALIAGGVYRLFGIKTAASEIILTAWSLGLTVTSYLFYYRAFAFAGASRLAAVLGLATCAFLPLNFVDETVTYRVWEGALAAALGALIVSLVVRLDARHAIPWRHVVLLSGLSALLLFINPAMGLAAYAACLLLTLRRLPPIRWPGVALTAGAVLALVLTPWVVRNHLVLGEFVPLRSNFGLELALANHPAAAGADDEHAVFYARLHEIHPFESPAAFARMKEVGGEVAYARMLGEEAKAWMAANPGDTARLAVTHLRQYYFPPAWFWTIYEEGSVGTQLKQALTWAISIFGLAGIVVALARRRRRLHYLAIMALVPCLPYLIVQPVPRYRYLVYAPLIFFSAYLVSQAVALARARLAARRQQARAAATSTA